MNPLETVKSGTAGLAEKFTGENPKLFSEVVTFVEKFPDGISGLFKQFQDKGLGDVVLSLTGKGPTVPITAAQILQGFGSEKINAFAASSGLDPKIVPEKIAAFFPKVVEKFTPVAKAGVV